MDSKDLIQSKWINTPFSYTRISKNLTLLQQAVLVKVSEHLQPYIKDFFGNPKLYKNRTLYCLIHFFFVRHELCRPQNNNSSFS